MSETTKRSKPMDELNMDCQDVEKFYSETDWIRDIVYNTVGVDQATMRLVKTLKAEIEKRLLSQKEIAEIIDQAYDCDHNGSVFIPNWEYVSKAIYQRQQEKLFGNESK